ncbi:MAG TPA: TIGR02996 domain-containing protein, partial [Kofleriaceae bacterium]
EQTMWLELVPDPKARAWCLDHVFDRAGGEHGLAARLDALAKLAPDPRIARAIAPIAATAPALVEHHGPIERDRVFDAVYAAPDDDAPRAVLADALIDRGDPRGELIALQLRGETDRVRELLRAHGHGWTGVLGLISKRVEFRRGFPAKLALDASVAHWCEVLANQPELATIDALDGEAESIARLLAGPLADRICELDVTFDSHWQRIAAMELPQLRALRMFRNAPRAGAGKRDLAFARYLGTHPLITSIGCIRSTFERLPARVIEQIDELELWGDADVVLQLWERLPHLQLLRCTKGFEVELRRDEPDLARIRPIADEGLGNPRTYLPRAIRRIDVVGGREHVAALLKRDHGYDIRTVDPPPNIVG